MDIQVFLIEDGQMLLNGDQERCLMNKSNEEALREWKEKEKLLDIQREIERVQEEKLKMQLEEQLHVDPTNIDLLLKLALFELDPPEGDPDRCIEYLNRILRIDENNVIALLFFAHLHEYVVFFIPDALLAKIENLHTDNTEYNSMLKYVASWSYSKFRKNNPAKEEELLKESIEMWPHHVWNYVHLARLYVEQDRIAESRELAQKALNNVQKVYAYDSLEFDTTSIDDFLNAEIKGINLNEVQVIFVKELLQ